MSGLINKVKDALHSDKDKTHEQPEGTHGTHGSKVANAADPRYDSDRDHRAASGLGGSSAHTGPTAGGLGHSTGPGHTAGGLGGTSAHTGPTAGGLGGSSAHNAGGLGQSGAGHTAGGLGSTGGIGHRSENLPEGTVGPHGSKVANAVDPRYDSDRDHRAAGGLGDSSALGGSSAHTGHTTGGLGQSTGAGHTAGGLGGASALGGSSAHTGPTTGGLGHRSENLHEGNHSGLPGTNNNSRLHEGTHTGGLNTYDQTTTGTSGLSSHGAGAHGPNSGLTGTHGPNSGLTGTHSSTTHGAHDTGAHGAGLGGAGSGYGSGPGPAANTAGPHKSDLLNKADPRVDSNLDGSKTVGKEKTFDQSGTNFAGRDPTDAAQVPPSVLQKHVPTEIAHDDPSSDHGRRHSSVNKEHHTGL